LDVGGLSTPTINVNVVRTDTMEEILLWRRVVIYRVFDRKKSKTLCALLLRRL
jgi:hypothetical protein